MSAISSSSIQEKKNQINQDTSTLEKYYIKILDLHSKISKQLSEIFSQSMKTYSSIKSKYEEIEDELISYELKKAALSPQIISYIKNQTLCQEEFLDLRNLSKTLKKT